MRRQVDRNPKGAGGSEVLVLCYHAISEDWPAPLAVTPIAFERQLTGFLRAGYRATTFADAVADASPGRNLAVTFDDAYRSVFERAFPILRALGVPATVFAPTRYTGANAPPSWPGLRQWLNGPWERELIGLSWEQLGELAGAGWEIGSHTRSHPHLRTLDAAALADELAGSRADIEEHLGLSCTSVAYPYGEEDQLTARAAAAAGYTAGATIAGLLDTRNGSPDPLRWPRVGVVRGDSQLRLSVKVRLQRHPRVWNLAQRARGAAGAC
jgi:peptidoglycan/xylan/chitin deacetylase (PgdA/CDA1 family)